MLVGSRSDHGNDCSSGSDSAMTVGASVAVVVMKQASHAACSERQCRVGGYTTNGEVLRV